MFNCTFILYISKCQHRYISFEHLMLRPWLPVRFMTAHTIYAKGNSGQINMRQAIATHRQEPVSLCSKLHDVLALASIMARRIVRRSTSCYPIEEDLNTIHACKSITPEQAIHMRIFSEDWCLLLFIYFDISAKIIKLIKQLIDQEFKQTLSLHTIICK